MFSRVFGRTADNPSPAGLVSRLHESRLSVTPHFRGDDLGWTQGELRLPGGGTPVYLQRFLTDVDDLRADLNTFAAELETMDYSPNNTDLMRHVIQASQLMTIRAPVDQADESALETLIAETCRFLAAATDGVYQSDGLGWFAADGTLLIQEY